MDKSLLEMVEELNRRPVSERPPVATPRSEASVADDDREDDVRDQYKRLLATARRLRPAGQT